MIQVKGYLHLIESLPLVKRISLKSSFEKGGHKYEFTFLLHLGEAI